ncbi:DUF805 domain-containing protein [Pedobacter gandavensis]|uniref:DUF805 domain-containing protein n=1 Tax=Pedobacter gandavensis TaxID=2679963 RepID=A0ABR6F006_9SPHI|nr:DUF805 domain-containing protein [Pedobacter gandavensis]MBB2150552.1 DUF805 domain-containing protein [Pedobacter gandavensis]
MFQNPFSFEGRIRRTEYGISSIIFIVIFFIIRVSYASDGSEGIGLIGFAILIPLYWFFWAQGAKRCHDLDKSGWWQIIPFYALWLLFQDGLPGENGYGSNPKGLTFPFTEKYAAVNPIQFNQDAANGNKSGYDGEQRNSNSENEGQNI